MSITAQIDENIKSLRKYFQKKFELLESAIEESKNAPMVAEDVNALESQQIFFHIEQFIKPDMVINLYGLIEFWLKIICDQQQKKNNINLSYNEFKKSKACNRKSELFCLQKYLTNVVNLDLNAVCKSYEQLDNLRNVRNKFIHSGGHVLDKKEKRKFEAIKGVFLSGTLILIDDSFIFDSIDHAKIYLFEAAKF